MLEEQPVSLGELSPETLVEDAYDLRQRHLLVDHLAGPDIGGPADICRLALAQFDRAGVHSFEPIVLELYLVAQLEGALTIARQMRQ